MIVLQKDTCILTSLIILLALVISDTQAQSLNFNRKSINVGTLTEDDSAKTYHFPFQNVSTLPVKIIKAETTCGCTQPIFKKTPIAPGEKGKISITFYPLGRVGKMNRSVYFYTEQAKNKDTIRLTLIGNVLPSSDPYINYPYAMGSLRLMQSTVNFRNIKGNHKQMVSVEVINAGKDQLQLTTSGLPKYITFMSNPTTIAPAQKADLIFIIDPKKCSKKGHIDADFLLEGLGNIKPIQRAMNIKGNVE